MRRILVICLLLVILVTGFTFIVSASDETTSDGTITDKPVIATDISEDEVVLLNGPWVPVTDD